MKKPLTKGEEEVMQALWKLEKGFLKDIVDMFPAPKPHSNTIATVLKVLTEKEYIGIENVGRLNRYYPLVKKSDYSDKSLKRLVEKYFGGSFKNAVSSMLEKKELSMDDLELLLKEIKNDKR